MWGFYEFSEITQITHSTFFMVPFVVLLTLCNAGSGEIVVYDGFMGVAEFPDIELPYTQSIRRNGIEGVLVTADPLHACVNITRPPDMNYSMNFFVLMSGNFCTFETKVRNARLAGYALGIIYTYRARVENFSNLAHYRYYSDMPTIVVKTEHGLKLKENYLYEDTMRYRLVVFPNNSFSIMTFLLLFSIVAGLFLVIMLAFTVIRFFQQSSTVHNGRLSSQHLRQLQTSTYQKGDLYETCAICLEDYKDQDKLRILPCSHGYHMKCIDPWLTNNRRICPVCKRKVLMGGGNSNRYTNENFEETENTPLLRGSRIGPRSAFSYSSVSPILNIHHTNFTPDETVSSNVLSLPDADLQPERYPGAYIQPERYPGVAMQPERHPGVAMQPERHPDAYMQPEIHPDAYMQPEIHPGVAMQPEIHPGAYMQPERHPGVAMQPERHPGVAMQPERHPGVAMHPEGHPGVAMHPEGHPGVAMHPEGHPGVAMHPEEQIDESLLPERQAGEGLLLERQPGEDLLPERQPDEGLLPERHLTAHLQPES